MAWNTAHVAKGSLSVPPPDRVEAASCFFLPGRAGRNPVPDQSREVQSDTSEGRHRGRESIYFLDGLTATTSANTLVRQFRKPG